MSQEDSKHSDVHCQNIFEFNSQNNNSGDNIKLFAECSDTLTIKHHEIKKTGANASWQSAFGQHVFVAGKDKVKICYEIKIINTTKNSYIAIGVDTNCEETQDWCFSQNSTNYCYYCASGAKYNIGKSSPFGEKSTNNDIIKMELDLIDNRLSFWKNGKLMGTSCNNIKSQSKEEYRLAISMYDVGDIIQLQKISVYDPNGKPVKKDSNKDKIATKQGKLIIESIGMMNQDMNEILTKVNNSNDKDELYLLFDKLSDYSENIQSINLKWKELNKVYQNIQEKLDDKLCIDEANYERWDYRDVIKWIMSLENGIFIKYQCKLKISLSEWKLTGSDLPNVTKKEWKEFGVETFGHCSKIVELCKKLQTDHAMENVE